MNINTATSESGQIKTLSYIQQVLLIIGFLSIVLFIPRSWVFFWDYPKMIIVHVVVLLSLGLSIVRGWNRSLDILDLSILFFVSWQFLSYTWSQYPGLVWYEAFHWLILMGIYFVVRKTDFSLFNKKLWAWVFIGAMLFNNILLSCFHIEQYLSSESGMNLNNLRWLGVFFSHSCNYITSILVITLPLYTTAIKWTKLNKFISILLVGVQSFLILICNSRASAFALIIIGLIIFIGKGTVNRKELVKIILPVIIVFSTIYVSILENPIEYLLKFNPIVTLTEESGDERMELWKRSAKLIAEGPLRGHGANTWQIQHMKFGYSDIKFSKLRPRQYTHAHNLLLETGAELGITGMINLLCIFIVPFFWYFGRWKKEKSTIEELTIVVSTLAFIIISSFYGVTQIDHTKFGSLDILFVILLGLNKHKKQTIYVKTTIPFIFILLTGISLYYKYYIHKKHDQLEEISYMNRSKADPKIIMQKIKEVYHPIFFQYRDYRPIIKIEAQNLWIQNRHEEAINIMNEAIEKHHYNIQNWMLLGDMYSYKGDINSAIDAYRSCIQINANYTIPRIKLAELSLQLKNWVLFDKSISFYHNDLLPNFHKNYNEELWELPKNNLQLRHWTQKCELIDKAQELIFNKHQSINSNRKAQ